MENVYVFNIGSIHIHGKEFLRKFTLDQKYREEFHDETDVWHIWKVEIYGLNPINWEDSSWKQLSLVSDEELISLKMMNRNANLTPTSFLSMQEDFNQDNGHSSDLDQKRSRILRPQGEWDRVAELMMIKFEESGHPNSFPCHESTDPRNA